MATISLKINIVKSNNVKTMQVRFNTRIDTHTRRLLGTFVCLLSYELNCRSNSHTHTHTHTHTQFDETMIVYDACRLIRERVPDAASGQRESPPPHTHTVNLSICNHNLFALSFWFKATPIAILKSGKGLESVSPVSRYIDQCF